MGAKFIITNGDALRFGMVTMHKDLLLPGEECLGGGLYEFDYVEGKMKMWGKSYDYGRPKWSMVNNLYVPESLRGLILEYEDCRLENFVNIIYR